VPILGGLEDESFVSPSGIRKLSPGRSVVGDEDDMVSEQPTVIRGDASGSAILDDEPLLASSDSDVRLVLPEGFSPADSHPDVTVQGDSDSDVRLIDERARRSRAPGGRSDSDVKLVTDEGDTVSDVRLLSGDDVRVAKSGSDSDVALVSSGKPGGGSIFDDDEELRPLAGDSGIALESIADSGIALEDSSVARPGGGIESSIISLAEDSGIALSSDSVKGSGIQVGSPTDSGIALEALNEGGATQPMMRTTRRRTESDDTQFEMTAEDSEFELATGVSSDSNDTSVILFDDDEAEDYTPAPRRGGRKQPAVESYVAAEGDEVVELDEEFDAFDEGGSAVAIGDEDEDLEFEAADEDFDEGFQTGESAADFAPAGQRVAVAPDPEFSGATFAGLAATSALLVVCGMMMFDLVRSMWGYNDPVLSSWILEPTKGLF
jgi:hypothetical protein